MTLPTTKLVLSVSCKSLPKKDTFSKSDPVCILYQKSKEDEWIEAGRTEKITNNPDPIWQTKFHVDFSFEERQWIKFEVYDWDKAEVSKGKLADQDLLGSVECLLAQVVSTPGKTFVATFADKKKGAAKSGGEIHICAEEASAQKETIELTFAATNLENKDMVGKSDPFYTLSKQNEAGDFVKIFTSEVVKNNLSPVWKRVTINVSDLCNGDFNKPIKMDVYDHDSVGKHDIIGSLTLTVGQLMQATLGTTTYDVINASKVGKKNYTNSGKILLKHFHVNKQDCSFFDFIRGGTKLQFTVGIDFTASNGKVTEPSSLHYRSSGGDNAYTLAIKAVGETIELYDADKKFPALGFGARVPPNSHLSHEFFLNMKTSDPFCIGTQGILEAYDKARNSVTLYGPTCFAPIINHVARIASMQQSNGGQYFVLLILTDGAITDFDETRAAIVAASKLPMSIIIVGIGDENFQTMEYFDGDKNGPIKDAQGNKAERDIVQFVEMKKYLGPSGGYNRDLLAREILAEVPHQLVSYMNARGYKPPNY